MNSWRERAIKGLSGIKMTLDFPMAELTTFKIGGPIDLLVEPGDPEQLGRVLDFCRLEKVPWLIIGAGSNLLVRDKGIRGLGIRLSGEFTGWEVNGKQVLAGAGILLADLVKVVAGHGLSGLEFACGIPGTVGGAVFMNAGAYDGEISQVLGKTEFYSPNTGLTWSEKNELNLGYRFSRFQLEPEVVITRVIFQLQEAASESITAKITSLTCQRESKQPLDFPSAGSVFKRPVGFFVGPLIEKAGLKGYSIGGARISPKHAGFIVNFGGATARDVLDLIALIQAEIKKLHGVELIPEIRVIGEE